MKRNCVLGCLLIALAIILSGCWDRVEIEQRRFTIGIGIDRVPPGAEAQLGERGFMELTAGKPKYRIVYALARLGAKEAGGEGKKTGKGEMDFLPTEAESGFESARSALLTQDRKLFFEHIKLIVLGEELAKENISDPLDFFSRDPEMRRRMRIVVSQGKAEDFLKLKPLGETELPIVIVNMIRSRGTSKLNPEADLGHIMEKIHRGEAFDVPYMIKQENEPRIYGSAIFRKNRMVDTLGEIDSRGVNWMRGTMRGGVVSITLDGAEHDIMLLELFSTKTRRKIKVDENGNIIFLVNIKVKGSVGENQLNKEDPLSEEYFKKVSGAVARQIEREVITTHQKLTSLNADVIEIGRQVHQEHPQLWEQIGDHWDEVFPTVKILAKVEVEVNRVGLIRN